jgi:hypothetical protein
MKGNSRVGEQLLAFTEVLYCIYLLRKMKKREEGK